MNQQSQQSRKAQIVYFSHGGGPFPLLGEPSHQNMVEFMQKLPETIREPEAILVISAHWEEKVPTLLSSSAPGMLYDYYGFPEESYTIQYPAPGQPELAGEIAQRLKNSGFSVALDSQRGFDHGLFVPLKLMYPNATIPALQLSLIQGLDASSHLEMGKALQGLMDRNILIIGSGFSFHNMYGFDYAVSALPDGKNEQFQDWLIETCTGPLSWAEREQRLQSWEEAPSARYCHPREEHLLPLHVCAAATQTAAEVAFDGAIAGKRAVALLWK